MRTAAGFHTNGELSPAPCSSSSCANATHPSAWHSPVPYLFGGLAAMLGLIAVALLILACSYWKLSGYLEGGSDGGDSGRNSGDGNPAAEATKPSSFVVIMAGDEKPTFLATPISTRPAPFGARADEKEGKAAADGEAKTPLEPAVTARGGDATQQSQGGGGEGRPPLNIAQ